MSSACQTGQYFHNCSFFVKDILIPGLMFSFAVVTCGNIVHSLYLHVGLKLAFSFYFYLRLKGLPVMKWNFTDVKDILKQVGWAVILSAITLNIVWIPFVQEWIREGQVYLVIPNKQLIYAFIVSLASGLSEELVFRGYLQYQMEGFLGSQVLATVLLSFIFAALHLPALVTFGHAFVVALLYTFALKKFRHVTIFTLILAHFLNNFISNILYFT